MTSGSSYFIIETSMGGGTKMKAGRGVRGNEHHFCARY
jgi:hypothetical protein